jgi:UDP-glucose 4-epimerase
MDERSICGEIFNVGSKNRISILELAKRVVEATESDSEFVFVPYDKVYGEGIEDMLHRIPSLDKIDAAIGWRPSLDLDQILADVISHTRAAAAAEKGAVAAAR